MTNPSTEVFIASAFNGPQQSSLIDEQHDLEFFDNAYQFNQSLDVTHAIGNRHSDE